MLISSRKLARNSENRGEGREERVDVDGSLARYLEKQEEECLGRAFLPLLPPVRDELRR